jgi:hypothetical protein
MKLSELARTATFAHLCGLGAKRAQAEDEEDTKKLKRAEDEEDKKESRRAEDDEEEKEAEDDTEDAEDEPDEDKKSRKAKRAQADDEEEAAEARGRRLERARAQAIFESPAAGIRPDIAAQLAFKTRLPSSEAIALLARMAEGAPRRRADLAERMATVPSPNIGIEGAEPNASHTLAAQILAAGKKARGER